MTMIPVAGNPVAIRPLEDSAMLTYNQRRKLETDFKVWGVPALDTAIAVAKQYGVLCSGSSYSDGTKG